MLSTYPHFYCGKLTLLNLGYIIQLEALLGGIFMEVSEFFQKLLGVVDDEPSAAEEPNAAEEPSAGNEPVGEVEPSVESYGGNDSDIREMIRDELRSIMKEAYEVEQKKQKAARAASVQTVPSKEPERSVEDIMAERYKNALGVKENKGE